MTLQRRLLLLHLAFVAFALVSAITTVFAVQMQVQQASARLGDVIGELRVLQNLLFDVQTLDVHFHEVVQQGRPADAQFDGDVESVAVRLDHVGEHAGPDGEPLEEPDRPLYRNLAAKLRQEANLCMQAVAAGDLPSAQIKFKSDVEPLLHDITLRLRRTQQHMEQLQQRSATTLASYDSALLLATLAVAAVGTAIVIVGTWIVRRRLLLPLGALQEATKAFRSGDLSYRVQDVSPDELGLLGAALNEMASDLDESHRVARRTEAMEAAVTLARGVAHDFKNLLQGATSALEELKTERSDEPSGPLATAIRACEQAAMLSRRLGRVGSEEQGYPEPLSIGETVQTILDSLDRSLFADITVSTDIADDAVVLCDRDKLTQAILNLVYNACEAMPQGGRLHIATHRSKLTPGAAVKDKNTQVNITVEDTGKGIAKEIQHRVFEPLVSTKPRRDSGPRGLGLAIVYAAVTSSGGNVQLRTSGPQGTTFAITLPAAA